MMMSKKEVMKDFKEYVLPSIRKEHEQDRRIDRPARREAWNNYTDMLHKDRLISDYAYDQWACPW